MPLCTPEWVDDTYGKYWEGCLTLVHFPSVLGKERKHPPVPAWYTNAIYDYRTRETWWQFFVRTSGFQQAMAQRAVFVQGFNDVHGNWWCGHCYWHAWLINLGEQIGYPALACPVITAGYASWLAFAQCAGVVAVEDAVRAAQRLLAEWSSCQATYDEWSA